MTSILIVQIAQSLEEMLNDTVTVNITYVHIKDNTLHLFGKGFVSVFICY